MNIPVHFFKRRNKCWPKEGRNINSCTLWSWAYGYCWRYSDYIEVDLENLEIGQTLNISDISLPEGTRPVITDRDFVIANIAKPGESSDDEDDDETTDEAEGETPEAAAEE